jgi:hypothetical protein
MNTASMIGQVYVVRCSIVGPEPMADQMSLEEAQRRANLYNELAATGQNHCRGVHTVELAENEQAKGD